MEKTVKNLSKNGFLKKKLKYFFSMFSKSSIKPYGLDFFEIFLELEITATKNTTLLILYQ